MRAAFAVAAAGLLVAAGAAVLHLEDLEHGTLVVYTTPALRDLLEMHIFPGFEAETGWEVEPVYLAAGAQYQRLRLSGSEPEAELFLHSSPLFIERGYAEHRFSPMLHPLAEEVPPAFHSRELGDVRATGDGAGPPTVWFAFAWSPLVEVYRADLAEAPDLLDEGRSFGFPHPRLSNNGVYAALFFEQTSPEAGRKALARTVVQPTNARTNIGGVADGSFDVTLGYEAVTLFYQGRGAQVRMDVPVLGDERVTMPVVFCAGLVRHHDHPGVTAFVEWLLRPEVQDRLHEWGFRSITRPERAPEGGVALDDGVRTLEVDWSDWEGIEAMLPDYEVG